MTYLGISNVDINTSGEEKVLHLMESYQRQYNAHHPRAPILLLWARNHRNCRVS